MARSIRRMPAGGMAADPSGEEQARDAESIGVPGESLEGIGTRRGRYFPTQPGCKPTRTVGRRGFGKAFYLPDSARRRVHSSARRNSPAS